MLLIVQIQYWKIIRQVMLLRFAYVVCRVYYLVRTFGMFGGWREGMSVYSDSGFALQEINLHKSFSLTFEMFWRKLHYNSERVCTHFYAGPGPNRKVCGYERAFCCAMSLQWIVKAVAAVDIDRSRVRRSGENLSEGERGSHTKLQIESGGAKEQKKCALKFSFYYVFLRKSSPQLTYISKQKI